MGLGVCKWLPLWCGYEECGEKAQQATSAAKPAISPSKVRWFYLLAIVNFCKNESPKMLRSFVLLALFGASAAGVTKTTMTVSERMTCTTHIAT